MAHGGHVGHVGVGWVKRDAADVLAVETCLVGDCTDDVAGLDVMLVADFQSKALHACFRL